MIDYTYKCTNDKCENFGEFTVEANMNDKVLKLCPICRGKVNRVYKSVNVALNFEGSYNITRTK